MDSDFEMFLVLYMLYVLYEMYSSKISNRGVRRMWMRPNNLNRETQGYFTTTFLKIKNGDPEEEEFFGHTRMQRQQYDLLLDLLRAGLTKNSKRQPIDFECRLALTLSYLSQGVSIKYLSWSYKMGRSTVRQIVLETCELMWKVLSPIYVVQPTEGDTIKIIQEFWSRWDMPNCLGAIDGKHVNIQCPDNTGSTYFNYKKNFSIVLMAVCDAKYVFTYVDVGAYGSQSDGGILKESLFGKKIDRKLLPLLVSKPLPGTQTSIPYFFVSDAAFPLKENIMRLYPGRFLTEDKNIFNYRLSRAWRIIENSFGILVSRWRILRNTLNLSPENAEKVVLASIALHNFIMINKKSTYCSATYVDWETTNGVVHDGLWRQDGSHTFNSCRIGSNNASRTAFQNRDILKNHFINEGEIHFQYDRAS